MHKQSTMSHTHTEPMVFIETTDEVDNSKTVSINLERYDHLSQLDTSWKVVRIVITAAKDSTYDADDEMEVDI